MPPAEPTPTDVNAVAALLDNQPAPAAPAAPAEPASQQPQQQPAAPTQQPAPTQQQGDPFQQLFVSEQPSEPTAQTPPTQPQQPTEPTPQPQQPVETPPAPQAPAQPATPTAPELPAQEQTESFDDYMKRITGDIAPAPDMPDASQINPESEEDISKFFTDLMTTAEQRFESNYARKQAIQNSERQLWDGAFDKYDSLRANKPLRDMVHAIRRAEFDKGVAITPTQAADRLLDALKQQYQQGVADNQVQTTIESVQPQGGGSQDVPTTLTNQNVLESVQTGGEVALTEYLNSEIKAGRL